MKLSAFTVVDAIPAGEGSGRDRYQEVLQLAAAADEAGLKTLWVAEHHFHDGGLSPSPPVLLATIAARTQRLRVGVLVSVLPLHNPIELAEQYAMVDRLSGGRLDLGLGSGYIPLELDGFGVDAATKRERFDRGYETLLAAMRGDAVRWSGAEVRLNVVPLQRPHPPLWIAVQRREAIPFVGRRGVAIALIPYATVGGIEELAAEIGEYRAALPEGTVGHVSVALHLYAGPQPERARSAFQRYLYARRAHQSTFYLKKAETDPESATVAAIERQGFALFGTAEDVAGRLRPFAEAGVDEVLGIFDFGGLHVPDVVGSVRALGSQI